MSAVSVIIPAYNAQSYLAECLDSVVAQTFDDIEIIVVDDGSTDATAEIARSYAARDPRIRLLQKPNGGVSDARNYGIDNSTGLYICFLDADDCLYPYTVDLLLSGLKNNDCKLSIGRIGYENGIKFDGHSEWLVYGWKNAVANLLYQDGTIECSPCASLYARELFLKLRFKKGIRYEDLDLTYRLIENANKVAFTNEVVYYYRPNPMGFINTFTPARFDVLDVTRRIEEYMTERHPELLAAARDRRLSANFNMFGLISACDSEGRYKAKADECYELIKTYRRESLLNPHVRLKNKIGIAVSYFGRRALASLSKLHYR